MQGAVQAKAMMSGGSARVAPSRNRTPSLSTRARNRGSRTRGAVQCKAGFIGSPTNLIVGGSTLLILFAGRFGLMPTSVRRAGQESEGYLKLTDEVSEEPSGDPAGFKISVRSLHSQITFLLVQRMMDDEHLNASTMLFYHRG